MNSRANDANNNDKGWSTNRENGSAWAISFIIWFFRKLGPFFTYRLTYLIVWFYYLADSKKRGHVIAHLRQQHLYLNDKSPFIKKPGFWQGLKLYQSFGENIIDRFIHWSTEEESRIQTKWTGEEMLNEQLKTKRGAILLSAHFGNIEMLRADAHKRNIPVSMLMFIKNAQKYLNMLKQFNPNVLDHLICLESMGAGDLALLQEKVDEGCLIGILADRVTEGAPEKVSKLPWFGQLASFPQGPFFIATLLQVPVYSIFVVKTGSYCYEVEVQKIHSGDPIPRKIRGEVINEMQMEFKNQLENVCTKNPYQWFNFYNFWRD
ncbi:MAG: hypothetical protein GY786_04620 [Proteobacteria bacterium]|nr:hypothetical protein [Pseudomonadota bacterium]